MADEVTELLAVLDSLGESSQFCASAELAPVLPGLEVEGVGSLGVPVTAADAKRLIERASQAPYGRGEETIVDTNVRRVWQLEPGQFSVGNPAWEQFVAGIVEAVRKEFGIGQKVDHELYKLLIYEEGSFFAPHRDTEKIPGMFATLVVALPSRHAGGTLIVTHDGETKRIDFGGADAEFKVRYAAFYADCQHEITPVTDGHRVCLVYNLALARRKTQPSAPANSDAVDAVVARLPKLFESRDKIAIPFAHQYTESALDPCGLKGADRARMAVLTRAAQRLGYQIFVALLTHHQSGSPDYETIDYSRTRGRRRYRRFDGGLDDDISGEDQNAQFEEVFDESRSLDGWLDPQGRKPPFGTMNFKDEELIDNVAAEDRRYEQEISEATGNEGATMDRWYRRAAVVLWPRDRYYRILAGEGPSHAVPALEELVDAGAPRSPEEEAAWRDFAGAIIAGWETREHGRREESLGSRMLQLLDRLGAGELAARFARDVLPQDCDGTEGPSLVRIGNRFGWAHLADPLFDFFAGRTPKDYTSTPVSAVSIFEALCTSPPALTDERRSVCSKLAGEVQLLIERWDGPRTPSWLREEEDRAGMVASIFRALAAAGEPDRLEQFVTHVLAHPKRYDLHTALIPAVKSVQGSVPAGSPGQAGFDRLYDHCLAELRQRTAKPIEPPADWSRKAKIECTCADCRELVAFMRDPVERVHRFARRQDLRQHLQQKSTAHGLDLTHETERKGSPQTLVCTKTQASYERRLAQFRVDSQLLAELEGLTTPSPAPAVAGREQECRYQ